MLWLKRQYLTFSAEKVTPKGPHEKNRLEFFQLCGVVQNFKLIKFCTVFNLHKKLLKLSLKYLVSFFIFILILGTSNSLWAADFQVPNGYVWELNASTFEVENITNDGTITLTTGTLKVSGDLTNNGTFNEGTGTVEFNGTAGTQDITGITEFHNLTHSGNTTMTLDEGDLDLNGSFTNSGGTFIADGRNMTVAGNWSNTATFTHGNNKITLDGASQDIDGTTTFYELEKIVATAATLTFQNGQEQIVQNRLVLRGADSQLLSLRSDANNVQTSLTLQAGGSMLLDYLDVKDNNANNGITLAADINSVNQGNNVNWTFGGVDVTWDGSESRDWNDPLNWDVAFVPRAADTIIIPSAPSNQPLLTSDVQVTNVTINSGANLNLDGYDLAVISTVSNEGTIFVDGNEAITSGTWDTNSGTVAYIGNGDGTVDTFTIANYGTPSYWNLTINDTNATKDIFQTAANLEVANDLSIANATMNISANSNTLTVTNDLIVNGGTLTATAGNVDINDSVNISSGTLIAPGSGLNFTVANDWTYSGGTFTHSSGTVTFDSAAAATIAGDTTFYNMRSIIAGKQFNFTAGTNQTIENNITFIGTNANKILLRSTVAGSKWDITSPNSVQNVIYTDVKDSDANDNIFFCLNGKDSGNNNDLWQFNDLMFDAPITSRTISLTPTFIGRASPNNEVTIKDQVGNVVIATTAHANGRFRAEVQNAMAAGVYDFYLYIGENLGNIQTNVTLSATPTTAQEPVIDSPIENQIMDDYTPTLTGRGKPGDTVVIEASDEKGHMPLTQVGTTTINGDGTFSLDIDELYGNTNYLTVTVAGVASSIRTIHFTDPRGYVFDSTTNKPIKDAVVTIYRAADGTMAEPGIDLVPTDVNPVVTGDDGYYSFITADSDYYIRVEAFGYEYPSIKEDLPDGRDIVTGSRGEVFTVAGVIIDMDHPMDPNGGLIRVTKNANKGEVVVGEVVTYTVTLENISPSNEVQSVLLEDVIPPGFKYLPDRALLDGEPVNPTGERPIYFDIGTMDIGELNILKYQMVVGSGVDPGVYENAAAAVYDSGYQLSNRASASVKVVHDPLFDLGTVIGKVFHDYNENGVQDEPYWNDEYQMVIVEQPIANVEIATEDGAVIRSDGNGLFHMKAIMPGRHVFRVDERTLPEGSVFTTDKAQIVDITNGLLAKVNFGVKMTLPQQAVGQSLDIKLDKSIPSPRLNVSLFNKELLIKDNALIDQAIFRIFTNYGSFINRWRLDIIDKDTKKFINSFRGDKSNLYDAIVWDGRDRDGKIIRTDRSYQYVLVIENKNKVFDETVGQDIKVRVIEKEEDILEVNKEQQIKEYREWGKQEYKKNVLSKQSIAVLGETLTINTKNLNANQIQIIKSGNVYDEIPLSSQPVITARAIIDGDDVSDVPVDVILPDGEYEIVARDSSLVPRSRSLNGGLRATNDESRTTNDEPRVTKINIGGNHLFFVAMTDLKMGYTKDRGKIEPVQSNDKYNQGFWQEGKAAYYLKGKVLGKYLITSSYDSEREKKELFRNLDPDKYYPVYGDTSSVDYKATNTQGDLYLLVEWDKSHAIWGNYQVGFDETEFIKFNRSLYGGKVDYKSVSTTEYGEADTRVIAFRARAKQKTAHNEFISTGGSLYYLKHKDIVEGSDQITIEVRDQVTGEVLESSGMTSGVDYDMDGEDGRLLFWQPIEMTVQSGSIINNEVLDGNPIYVVADYEYHPKDKFDESTMGARVSQAVTGSVIVGGTYVQESQAAANYELKGTDVTIHLTKDATVKAEYAQSESDASGSFVSLDGGLSFTEIETADDARGKAYGITGDARLFNRLGLQSYYKYISPGFSSGATVSEQGKELQGLKVTLDVTDEMRFTMRHDVQELIDGGTVESQLQVGSQKSETTSMQLVHESDRLRLTGEYFKHIVQDSDDDKETIGVRADYKVTDKLEVSIEREENLQGQKESQTTVGAVAQVTEKIELSGEQTIGTEGSGTKLGAKVNVTDKFTLTTERAVSTDSEGQKTSSTSVGAESSMTEKSKLIGKIAVTEQPTKGQTRTVTLGSDIQVDDDTKLKTDVGVTESALGKLSTTSVALDQKKKVTDEVSVTSKRKFTSTGKDTSDESSYGLLREKDGRKFEGTIGQKQSRSTEETSGTNIFGLSGDLNDKWALTGNYEKGRVEKHDGTELRRQALSLAAGYVDKDIETGKLIKSSTKIEARFDEGDGNDESQYVFHHATEGNLNENTSLYTKLELSSSRTEDSGDAAHYKEIVVGGAYRPIRIDRLNLLGRYTYLQGKSPNSQIDTANVVNESAHVMSLEGIYDLTSRLQLSEKFAYRIAKEKVEDFDFNRTRTWLMIHRLNYRLDKNWQASAEYRRLAQLEAQDAKSGYMIEATRRLSEYAQLGIGYNFTDFNDDLTNLSYTTQGPFIRITTALYDRTPEELARAKEKWRQERIDEWSSRLVRTETNNKDSPLGASLSYMYRLAEAAHSLGRHKDAQELYRDIRMTYQMMLAEARDYVVNQIEWEEKLSECQERAQGFYEQGDYVSAKQIWETILEELKKNPQERILDLEKCIIDDDKKRFYESEEINKKEGG